MTDPKYEAYDDEDALIMTWLCHSMTPKISRNYMFFPTTKEIWNNLSQAYSMKKDTTTCYEIENKIFNTKQGNLSVTDYYGTLNHLWIELNQYQNLTMQCTPDSTTLTQFIERIHIFKFLSDLHSKFDAIWVQILDKEKFCSLSKVFHIVRGEETRRSVMLEGGNSFDGLALATGKGPLKGPFCMESLPQRLTVMIAGAVIVGKRVILRTHVLDFMKRRRSSNVLEDSNVPYKDVLTTHSESVEDPTISQAAKEAPALSKEELDRLRGLMDSLSKTSSPCALTMTGKGSSFLSFNSPSTESTWIVDSSATNHMTPHSLSFSSYTNSSGHKQITIANGSHIPITGYGNIHLQPSIHLKNVLHVPKLSTNLLSIHKVTKDLNCAATFFHTHYVFQDLATKRTIGIAKEQDGLYYLPHEKSTTQKTLNSNHQTNIPSWANS
ncbi:uncharacterized protein [Arachis hypogaea]|uniref:uncharacterized protein n=1 Tax=Arachis hypogaea TaxID=3818 RepID=UPI003B223E19